MINGRQLFEPRQTNGSSAPEYRVAIVGGGPGGLFTAWHLADKLGAACKVTIYEAASRLGGKIITGQFPGVGIYEAGAAEIYDYSALGYDPLRELIQNELGLGIKHIDGGACFMDGHAVPDVDALASHYGMKTRDVAHAFRAHCAQMLSPAAFYRSDLGFDNRHPWARMTAEEVLNSEIKDEAARRYIRTMAHSDVSAAPHQTDGLTFLKNVLMDVDGYMSIYSVVGGNAQIVDRLEEELDAQVSLETTVRAVEPLRDGTYRLEVIRNGESAFEIADYVVMALPLAAFSMIDFRAPSLRRAMNAHIAYFDRPGHYVRATLLFERPFWRDHVEGNWFMIDGFDGCCLYDEGSRNEIGRYGALGYLIAGNAALALANLSDDRIAELCLDALPPALQEGRELLIDRRIHRWMASVNAMPGGTPQRSRHVNHRPDPAHCPALFTVGDYMFDATLNGVLDSADTVTDLILSDVTFRRRALQTVPISTEAAGDNDLTRTVFDGSLLADLLSTSYGLRRGAKILSVGTGAGAMAAALRALGYEAVSLDCAPEAGEQGRCSGANMVGDLIDLPFRDGHFDVVIERGLCLLPRQRATAAVKELRRVVRRGIILGSVTTDLTVDVLEHYDLVGGLTTLSSRWDWSDLMFANGFDHVLIDPARLARAWKRVEEAGADRWYEDASALSYCIYQVVDTGVDRHEAAVVALPRADAPSHKDERTPAFATSTALAS